MASPVQHPTLVLDGQGPGLVYRIEGALVPTLHLSLTGQMPVMFEHHVFLWKNQAVNIEMMKLGGAFKRAIAGMPILMTQAVGAGDISFSRDTAGQVFAMHLNEGQTLLMREHQFLAATANIQYTFERVKGFGSMMLGNQGFWLDRFTGGPGGSIVWVHAHGNAFDITLEPGEVIDVEPGAWVYRDDSVQYEQKLVGLTTGFLAGGGQFIFNRFTGPGRVGIQSGAYVGELAGDAAGGSTGRVAGVVRLGVIAGLLSG